MTRSKQQCGLGFRDFESFNDAYLEKLSWRLHNNHAGLLSRVLTGKYCTDTPFLKATHRGAESHGWRGLLIGRDLIMSNAGWAIGNGESINIWSDPWLSHSSQIRPMGLAPVQFIDWTVKHLMMPSSTDWNRAAIQQVLPHEEERILSLQPSKTGAPDKLIWLGTTSGEYTMKSGYHKALELSELTTPPPTTVDMDWKKAIWNLQTSPKIKLFLWKIFQDALPVGNALASRNIGTNQPCIRCNTDESINHLFLHCEFAHKVWKLAPFSSCMDSRGLLDLSTVWLQLCKATCFPPVRISTGPLAPWILWSLWLAKNNRIFNNKETTPEEVITKAIAAAQEWLREQITTPIQRPVGLKPTPHGPSTFTSIHSDVAWRSDLHLAGLGWIITAENQSRPFLSHYFYVSSPLVAEGLALREALICCVTKRIRTVRCSSDSLQLVRALNEDSPIAEIYGITSDIRNLILAFDFVSFVWIQRSENKAADALAKQALLDATFVAPPLNLGV